MYVGCALALRGRGLGFTRRKYGGVISQKSRCLSSPHPYVGETPEDPHHFLYPIIILFGIIRAHTVNNNVFDVGMLFFFGFLGYG